MSDATDPASREGQQLPPEEACPQPEPAQEAAEETHPAGADDDAEFQADLADAIAEGKIFAASHQTRLAALIPKLSKLRRYTAQRQEDYVKGSRKGRPKWGALLKFFRAQTGVTLSAKTLKKYIDEFEGIAPAPRPQKVRAMTITPAVARKMGLALLAVHEALSNRNEQGNVLLKPEDIAPILEMAPSPEQLNRLLGSVPEEAEAAKASKIALAAAPGPADAAGAPAANPLAKESPLPALKSGDVAGLTARVIERSVQDFEAVLGDLSPDAFADGIRNLADGVQKKFRRPDFGRISVRVSHIPRKPMVSAESRPSLGPEQPSLFSASLPSLKVA